MSNSGDAIISAQRLSKTYRMSRTVSVDALKDVSFDIMPGEFTAIMGHSGSGKSTLMNILGCLDVPSGGTFSMAGTEISKLKSKELAKLRNKTIGFVFQSYNLLPMLSSWENVALPLIYSENKKNRKRRAIELLADVGLEKFIRNKPTQLSGGQRQRVAIARALVNDPDLILADEPTGNLDSQTEKEIIAIFNRLNDKGKTIIMVTHEEELGAIAHRVIRLKDGNILVDTARG